MITFKFRRRITKFQNDTERKRRRAKEGERDGDKSVVAMGKETNQLKVPSVVKLIKRLLWPKTHGLKRTKVRIADRYLLK